jgi:hypothetical protein
MHAKRSWVGLAAGLVALVVPAPASAVPDAGCPGPPGDAITLTAGERGAQTFTAQNTGSLTRGELLVMKGAATTGDWTMQILTTSATGTPTNQVLASTTIADAGVPTGTSTLGGDFAVPAQVSAGTMYALSLSRSGAPWDMPDRFDNPCEGAQYRAAPPPATFAVAGSGTQDAIFQIYVDVPDTAPPETTILNGPKDKTRKRTATFEFTGTDTRAIASFQCKLDAGAFTPCTSPHTVKVKKGKHTFQVQAIDEAGNVGSPATDTWKRKKKKKH